VRSVHSAHERYKYVQARISWVTRVMTRDVGVVSSHLRVISVDASFKRLGDAPQGCTQDRLDQLLVDRS
jgi:hypothetical protein